MSTKKNIRFRTVFLIAACLVLTVIIFYSMGSEDTGSDYPAPGNSSAVSSSVSGVPSGTIPDPEEISEFYDPEADDISQADGPLITMADFDWYTKTVSQTGFPEDAEFIKENSELYGQWKGYIKYDPKNTTGGRADFLLFFDLEPGTENDIATLHWYWSQYITEEEGTYVTDWEDTHYYGYLGDGQYQASGSGTMEILYFFKWNGVKYGLGRMNSSEGVPAILCLMRED